MTMVSNIAILLAVITLSSVTAQTFQYSRGWTNGKRDGHKEPKDLASSLEKILNPCQMTKLKYVLEGRPFNDRLFGPCDYFEEEENQPKRYKAERSQEPPFDAFQ